MTDLKWSGPFKGERVRRLGDSLSDFMEVVDVLVQLHATCHVHRDFIMWTLQPWWKTSCVAEEL